MDFNTKIENNFSALSFFMNMNIWRIRKYCESTKLLFLSDVIGSEKSYT